MDLDNSNANNTKRIMDLKILVRNTLHGSGIQDNENIVLMEKPEVIPNKDQVMAINNNTPINNISSQVLHSISEAKTVPVCENKAPATERNHVLEPQARALKILGATKRKEKFPVPKNLFHQEVIDVDKCDPEVPPMIVNVLENEVVAHVASIFPEIELDQILGLVYRITNLHATNNQDSTQTAIEKVVNHLLENNSLVDQPKTINLPMAEEIKMWFPDSSEDESLSIIDLDNEEEGLELVKEPDIMELARTLARNPKEKVEEPKTKASEKNRRKRVHADIEVLDLTKPIPHHYHKDHDYELKKKYTGKATDTASGSVKKKSKSSSTTAKKPKKVSQTKILTPKSPADILPTLPPVDHPIQDELKRKCKIKKATVTSDDRKKIKLSSTNVKKPKDISKTKKGTIISKPLDDNLREIENIQANIENFNREVNMHPNIVDNLQPPVDNPNVEVNLQPPVDNPNVEVNIQPPVDNPNVEVNIQPPVDNPNIEVNLQPPVDNPNVEVNIQPPVDHPNVEVNIQPPVENPNIEVNLQPPNDNPNVEVNLQPPVDNPNVEVNLQPPNDNPNVEVNIQPPVDNPNVEVDIQPPADNLPKIETAEKLLDVLAEIQTEQEKSYKDWDTPLTLEAANNNLDSFMEALIECSCCYNEVPIEYMVQCYEGHLLCCQCLERYATESVYGQGKGQLKCLTTDCEAEFPESQLYRALPDKLFSKYEERIRDEYLNIADLENFIRCKFCNFAAVLDPGVEFFSCPQCKNEFCRKCQVVIKDHKGLTCEQIEKDGETKIRTDYEEKMAQAKIRTCSNCKSNFTKESGCNKITCRCGMTMCYICRKPKIDYKHYCQHLRSPTKKGCAQCKDCFLWSNTDEDDKLAIEEIKKNASKARIEEGFTTQREIGVPSENLKSNLMVGFEPPRQRLVAPLLVNPAPIVRALLDQLHQAQPAVQPRPAPAVQLRPAPAVQHRPAPAVQPRPAPAVQPHPAPAVQPRPAPAIQPRPAPAVQPHPAPAVQPHPAPAVQPRPAPAVQPRPAPAVQPRPAPAVQPRPAPAVQAPTARLRKAPIARPRKAPTARPRKTPIVNPPAALPSEAPIANPPQPPAALPSQAPIANLPQPTAVHDEVPIARAFTLRNRSVVKAEKH